MTNQVRTLKFRGQVGPGGLERIQEVLGQLAEIYNGCLSQYRMAERQYPELFNHFLQGRQLTHLRAEIPEFRTVLRRAQETTIKRVHTNWMRYRKDPKAGRPRFKPSRFRTIGVDSPRNPTISFSERGNPQLRIKGLPTVRLRGSRKPPQDKQPVRVSVTLKGKRLDIRLSYRHECAERSDPKEATNPLGVDVGLTLSMATSRGNTYVSPNEEQLTGRIRRAQREASQVVAAAMATGRAGLRAVLDDQNRQVLSARGKPRSELVWTNGEPTGSYLKARRRLQDLHERRAGLRNDFKHRATTQVVKQAVADGNDLISLEDLRIINMTASARGNMVQPGRNVRQKSGLNRRILREGWGEILTMLEYKAESAGIPTVRVNANCTSITCSDCGHRDRKSRRSQSKFRCMNCGHQDNEDHNASINIAARGLTRVRGRPSN